VKYSINFQADSTLLRVMVLRFLAELLLAAAGSLDAPSIDHPLLVCGSEENLRLRMVDDRAHRASVWVHHGTAKGEVLVDIYFHDRGARPDLGWLTMRYESDNGMLTVLNFQSSV
jgi:hypothetical protein